jgi:hypothetical protein
MAKPPSSRTILLLISLLAIVGVASWLGYYYGLFGARQDPGAAKAAEMPPEVKEEWDKAQQQNQERAQKINRPPSGS